MTVVARPSCSVLWCIRWRSPGSLQVVAFGPKASAGQLIERDGTGRVGRGCHQIAGILEARLLPATGPRRRALPCDAAGRLGGQPVLARRTRKLLETAGPGVNVERARKGESRRRGIPVDLVTASASGLTVPHISPRRRRGLPGAARRAQERHVTERADVQPSGSSRPYRRPAARVPWASRG